MTGSALAAPAASTPEPKLAPRLQPVQRILTDIDNLSDAELLATLLWSGTRQTEITAAYALLQKVHGNLLRLQGYSTQELLALGLDETRAARLRALLELENRLAIPTADDVPKITNPTDAARMMMMRLRGEEQEHVVVMSLDTRLHILGIDTVAIGAPNIVEFRMGDLFAPPVRHHAVHLILFHNHPAGEPDPSPEDLALTRDAVMLGATLKIKVLDHIIIGQGRFVSLKEMGHVKFV